MREEEIGERWPEVPDWADPRELDPEVRRDLRGLSKEGSEFVAGHLFMAGMLAEEDPALAWRHARAARSKGGRIAVVRETVGLVAYRAGEWAEAIAELRAARRMSGGPGQLPVIADCERALGHPEKAIELSRSAEAAELDASSAAELRIVVAGARADMGQLDAALAHLESAVQTESIEPYTARLFYAYADLLLQAERRDEAIEYFMKAAEVDVEEETDAGDRLTELADEELATGSAEPEELESFDELLLIGADVEEDSPAGRTGLTPGHHDDLRIDGPDDDDALLDAADDDALLDAVDDDDSQVDAADDDALLDAADGDDAARESEDAGRSGHDEADIEPMAHAGQSAPEWSAVAVADQTERDTDAPSTDAGRPIHPEPPAAGSGGSLFSHHERF